MSFPEFHTCHTSQIDQIALSNLLASQLGDEGKPIIKSHDLEERECRQITVAEAIWHDLFKKQDSKNREDDQKNHHDHKDARHSRQRCDQSRNKDLKLPKES